MWKIEDKFKVIIGGNTYIDIPNLVVYKNQPLFTIKRRESDGLLGVDIDVFDKGGERVATVRGGNIVQGNKEDYEIRSEMHHHSVIEKTSGRVICDIRRKTEAPDAELEISVLLYTPDGFLFEATPEKTNLRGVRMVDCTIEKCDYGIVIHENGAIGIG